MGDARSEVDKVNAMNNEIPPWLKQALTDFMIILSVGVLLFAILAGYVTVDRMTP